MAFVILRCLIGNQVGRSLKAKVRLQQSASADNGRSACIVGLACVSHCSLHSSAKACKIWEIPTQTEAEHLEKLYFDPKCLLDKLLQPLVDCGMASKPRIVFTPRLWGQFWRAKLYLQWPSKVTISAINTSFDRAEKNAYLLACDLFKNMGLLYQDSEGLLRPVNQQHVTTMLQALHSSSIDPLSRPPKFSFVTRPAASPEASFSIKDLLLSTQSHGSNLHRLKDSNCAFNSNSSSSFACFNKDFSSGYNADRTTDRFGNTTQDSQRTVHKRSQASENDSSHATQISDKDCQTLSTQTLTCGSQAKYMSDQARFMSAHDYTKSVKLGEGSHGKGSSKGSEAGEWCTDISAAWPYPFNVSSKGPSAVASQHAAVLLTCIKLKALGLLATNNHLCTSRLPGISRRIRFQTCNSCHPNREIFDPHYEIYSDASACGFGAYLLKKNDSRIHWLSNAWSEHFPQTNYLIKIKKMDKSDRMLQLDSFFGEFYSVVSAFYTWKHRFVGKRVMVWTDNTSVAQIINVGVKGDPKHKRVEKLFSILVSTCVKYDISLCASHVQRTENVAADLLSRSDVAAFRQVLPEASPCMKKTKKLLFWNPLQARSHSQTQLVHEKTV